MNHPRSNPQRPNPQRPNPPRFTRRSLLGFGAGALLLPGMLAACGSDGGSSSDTTSGATGPDTTSASGAAAGGTVRFVNWPAYIDENQQTLRDFEAATGIKVEYREDLNDNDEWYAVAAPKLENGRDIGADLVAPTGWMCGRVISKGWALEIDDTSVPNRKNLEPSLMETSFDPGHRYTLPWAQIRAGIAYDPNKAGFEITSVEQLFDPRIKGRVTFLTEMRDTLAS